MAKHKQDTGYKVAVFGASRLVGILLLVLMILVILFLGRTAYRFGYSVFHEEAVSSQPGEQITVTIPEGATVREIGVILQNAGLIRDANLFVVQERLSEYHKKEGTAFAPGTYRLSTAQTPTEMMGVLAGDEESGEEEA